MEIQRFYYEQTPKTPLIELNSITGELIFSGKSIPEDAARIYEPVYNWITEYAEDAHQVTNLRIDLEYFNTTSSLWMVKIFKALTGISKPEYSLIVHLYIPVEDFDEMEDFNDIKDYFTPISYALNSIPGTVIRLYATDKEDKIIKETMVFI